MAKAPEYTRDKDYQAPRGESFDVVLIKNGVGAHAAKTDDFARVPVTTSEGAYGARSLPEVEAVVATGYFVYQVVGPGLSTEGERMARQRAHDAEFGRPFDRVNV